jgi:hypothetical protein
MEVNVQLLTVISPAMGEKIKQGCKEYFFHCTNEIGTIKRADVCFAVEQQFPNCGSQIV